MDVTNQSKRCPKHSFFKIAVGLGMIRTRWKMVTRTPRDIYSRCDKHIVTTVTVTGTIMLNLQTYPL